MRKKSKYEALSVQDGTTPNLVPLVFEHFGFWGQEADNFLSSLSKKSKDSEGRSTEANFRTRWLRQISIIIQRCNARVILKKISSRLHVGKTDDFFFDVDIQHYVH